MVCQDLVVDKAYSESVGDDHDDAKILFSNRRLCNVSFQTIHSIPATCWCPRINVAGEALRTRHFDPVSLFKSVKQRAAGRNGSEEKKMTAEIAV